MANVLLLILMILLSLAYCDNELNNPSTQYYEWRHKDLSSYGKGEGVYQLLALKADKFGNIYSLSELVTSNQTIIFIDCIK